MCTSSVVYPRRRQLVVSFFQLIKSFWTRSSKKQLDTPKPEIDPDPISSRDEVCNVVFRLISNGDIDILFNWVDLEKLEPKEIKELAYNYAALLSLIGSGSFKIEIAKILFESAQDAPQTDKNFAHSVLHKLVQFEKDKEFDKDEPLIKPSKVFIK